MNSVFGIHQPWSFYNDEVTLSFTLDDCVPLCLKTYNTYEEAKQEALRLNLKSYKGMTLAGLLGRNDYNSEKITKIGNFIFESGWKEHLKIRESTFPLKNLSDDDLISLMKLAKVIFYEVIEHKSHEKIYFVKWSKKFWNKEVIEFLVNSNYIISDSKWHLFEPNKQLAEIADWESVEDLDITIFYKGKKPIWGLFMVKYPEPITHYNSLEEAWFFAIRLMLILFKKFPNEKKAFIENKNFKFKTIASIAGLSLSDLEIIEAIDLNHKNVNKIKGFIQLFNEPPFEIIERYKSINGKYVHDNYVGCNI